MNKNAQVLLIGFLILFGMRQSICAADACAQVLPILVADNIKKVDRWYTRHGREQYALELHNGSRFHLSQCEYTTGKKHGKMRSVQTGKLWNLTDDQNRACLAAIEQYYKQLQRQSGHMYVSS